MKWVLAELDQRDVEEERFDAKVTVLIESVRHHVDEEESEFFPKVRAELGRRALTDLGDTMAEADWVVDHAGSGQERAPDGGRGRRRRRGHSEAGGQRRVSDRSRGEVGAKATATSARKAAKATTTTAKRANTHTRRTAGSAATSTARTAKTAARHRLASDRDDG